jgi:hypothetical protein
MVPAHASASGFGEDRVRPPSRGCRAVDRVRSAANNGPDLACRERSNCVLVGDKPSDKRRSLGPSWPFKARDKSRPNAHQRSLAKAIANMVMPVVPTPLPLTLRSQAERRAVGAPNQLKRRGLALRTRRPLPRGCANCAGRTAPGLRPLRPSPAGTALRSRTPAPGARRSGSAQDKR